MWQLLLLNSQHSEQTSYSAENQCPFHAPPNFNHATQCSVFAQLFVEERKVLYTLSEQFIPLVVPLQKPDQLNQLLWLKTTHPACQEAGRFFFPLLFTNSKTELFSDSRISHLFFPHSQFSTILIKATLGKTCTCFPRKSYGFLLLLALYFCFNTVYQSVQPGQVSMVQRPSEKSLGRTQVVTSPLRIPLQKNSLKSEFCEECSRGASSHLLLVLQGTELCSLFLKWYFKASL